MVAMTGRLKGTITLPRYGKSRILEVRKTLPMMGEAFDYKIPLQIPSSFKDRFSEIPDDEGLLIVGELCSVDQNDPDSVFLFVGVKRFERLGPRPVSEDQFQMENGPRTVS